MAQATSFICDCCNERIEDQDCPVVVYIVAGVAPMHRAVQSDAADVTAHPLPQLVRDLLSKPVARKEYCAKCFAEEIGHPLVDADGKVVTAA